MILFLFRGEVVHNAEVLADFFRSLALDCGGHLGTGQVEEWLDVQVVRSHDQLEESLLLDVNKLTVPRRHPAFDKVRALQRLLNNLRGVVLVVSTLV